MSSIDQLIHRYLNDSTFRADFDRDPAGSCERAGIAVDADVLAAASDLGSLIELPQRISMEPIGPVCSADCGGGC